MLSDEVLRHFDAMQHIAGVTNIGSYLSMNQAGSMGYMPEMWPKQKLLMSMASQARLILEVGVSSGHSLLLMLAANPRCVIVGIDLRICPCLEYLNRHFDNRVVFFQGTAQELLPRLYTEFDLVHIDGDHNVYVVNDEIACVRGNVFVIDDVDWLSTQGQIEGVTLQRLSGGFCQNGVYHRCT